MKNFDNITDLKFLIDTPPKTWRPVVGGMFSLIIGTVNIYLSVTIAIIASSLDTSHDIQGSGWLYGIPLLLLGIITITGGLFTLGRKHWKLSLAGTVCGLVFPVSATIFIIAVQETLQTFLFLLPVLVLGIAAMWLTIASKPEFT